MWLELALGQQVGDERCFDCTLRNSGMLRAVRGKRVGPSYFASSMKEQAAKAQPYILERKSSEPEKNWIIEMLRLCSNLLLGWDIRGTPVSVAYMA